MATFKYSQNILDALDDLNGNLELTVRPSGTKALWFADLGGGGFIFEGKNLVASGADPDRLGGGRITGAEMVDGAGELVFSITDMRVSAAGLMAAFDEDGSAGIAYFIGSGDDRVIGCKEGDYLIGGAGDDVMTGKAGSDTFEFQAKALEGRNVRPVVAEHDVITDFDTKGADADELGIHQTFTYKAVYHGDDTRLDFEDGSTSVLEGVKKAAFTQYYVDSFDM